MSVAKSRALVQSATALGARCPHIHEGSFIMKGWMLAISLFLTLYSLCVGSVFAQSQGPFNPNPHPTCGYGNGWSAFPLGIKRLGLPVNPERTRKHEKTTPCELTGGACGEPYRSRALARGS